MRADLGKDTRAAAYSKEMPAFFWDKAADAADQQHV